MFKFLKDTSLDKLIVFIAILVIVIGITKELHQHTDMLYFLGNDKVIDIGGILIMILIFILL